MGMPIGRLLKKFDCKEKQRGGGAWRVQQREFVGDLDMFKS